MQITLALQNIYKNLNIHSVYIYISIHNNVPHLHSCTAHIPNHQAYVVLLCSAQQPADTYNLGLWILFLVS